jgi:FdhD protein
VSGLVWQLRDGAARRRPDDLAVEEPLEIRCSTPAPPQGQGEAGDLVETLTVTMRTPGHDFELVAGWLNSEGVVDSPAELRGIRYCTDPELDGEQRYNAVTADLPAAARERLRPRRAMTASSCGICGSASIEAIRSFGHPPLGDGPVIGWPLLAKLPDLLRDAQRQFSATGGIHGAALVDGSGRVLVVREDIGRHNAVDKVVGWALLENRLPLHDTVLVVSGRSSFEIVQKALRAGIGFVAGVSAASNLAVRLAGEAGMTLVGWVRDDRATVYTCPERVDLSLPR